MDFDQVTEPRLDKDGKPVPGALNDSADVGKVLATQAGLSTRYQLTGKSFMSARPSQQ